MVSVAVKMQWLKGITVVGGWGSTLGDVWRRPVPKPPVPIDLFKLVKNHLETKLRRG